MRGQRDEPRLNTVRAHRYTAKAMATHQAMAMTALSPICVPSSCPLSVSMIDVRGGD